jgi:glycosyltransferase involved in cell wall biosynthesis
MIAKHKGSQSKSSAITLKPWPMVSGVPAVDPSDLMSARIAIVDPVWTHYRYPVYSELAQHCRVDWIFSPAQRTAGYGRVTPPPTSSLRYIETPMRNPVGQTIGFWQAGTTRYLIHERPDVVMFSANPRSISFWMALVAGRILGIPVYAHGHGMLRRTRISWLYRQMMNLLLRLAAGYVAYSPLVRDTFAAHGFSVSKVEVAHNSMINPCPLSPSEKTGCERGVLFLGRLRLDSGMEALLGAAQRLREGGCDIELHIVGAGEARRRLQQTCAASNWVHWYGEVYDPARIREISQACFAGCHPGAAGLSVVHMMSLSLPVLVQNRLEHHGPEVAMVRDWNNGVRYGAGQPATGIDEALAAMLRDAPRLRQMQNAAYSSYLDLIDPSLATRLGRILLKQLPGPAFVKFRDAALVQTPPPDQRSDIAAE